MIISLRRAIRPDFPLVSTWTAAPGLVVPVAKMSLFAWLLWTLFPSTVGRSFQRASWSEMVNWVPTNQGGSSRPSFYQPPMFQDAPGTLVAPELLRPVAQKSPLPIGLAALLFPSAGRHRSVQGTAARAVRVWCGHDRISVRVDRFELRAWPVPSRFRLGPCGASRVSRRFLYFHYRLTECGGESQVWKAPNMRLSQSHASPH